MLTLGGITSASSRPRSASRGHAGTLVRSLFRVLVTRQECMLPALQLMHVVSWHLLIVRGIDHTGPLREGLPFEGPEHVQYNAQRAYRRTLGSWEPENARLAQLHGLVV